MVKVTKTITIISFFLCTILSAGYALAVLDADIISHTIPASVNPGEVFQVSITIQNTCTEGEHWVRPVGFASTHRLYSQTDPNTLWGPSLDVLEPGDVIKPGMYKTFTMLLTAPLANGVYPCNWQMAQNVRPLPIPFGELLALEIEVTEDIPKMLDSEVVSHTIPSAMCAGETRSISITVRNNGSTTLWYWPDFRLYAQNSPQPDDQWGVARMNFNVYDTISPGETRSFTANITAPTTPGMYNCNWLMQLRSLPAGTKFFGEKLETVVSVVGSGGMCDDGNECTGNGTCSGTACTDASAVPDGTACNTANTCTSYACTGGVCGGTINQGVACDDGNTCTSGDTCTAGGACAGIALDCSSLDDTCNLGVCNPYTVSCIQDSTYKNETACNDSLYCNGIDTCWGGTCEHTGNPCTPESCDEENDICGTPAEICIDGVDNDEDSLIDCADPDCDGQTCDDADACTTADICSGGICMGGATLNCDDSNICTDDSCEPLPGCIYTNNTNPCDDDLFCNGADICSNGFCAHGGDPCSPETCDEENDICVGCIADSDCDDGVSCTTDSCETDGSCTNTADNSLCNDGLFCNGEETCDPLAGCVAGTNPCPNQSCDEVFDECTGSFPPVPTFVSFTPDSGTSIVGEPRSLSLAIADGDGYADIKSIRFVIKVGTGTGTTSDAIIVEYRSAAPNRIYLYDQATSGWISAVMGTAALVENSLCAIDASQTSATGNGPVLTLSLNMTPKAAFIAQPLPEQKRIWLRAYDLANHRLGDLEIGAWSVIDFFQCDDDDDCNDGIGCTEDSCGPDGACLNAPDNSFCDDGFFCNGQEICNAVSGCLAGTDPCPGQYCDEEGITCVECLTDADCDDGAFCNGEETCSGGTCIAGTEPCAPPLLCNESMDICGECITHMDCDDGNECTDETCDASSACLYSDNTNPCDDGVFCNGSDACSGGGCSFHAGDPCASPLYCDEDSDLCVGCFADVDCDDGVACTVDTCEPDGTCLSTPDNSLCDDGAFCNGEETCDPIDGCLAGADPCPGQPCDEAANQCIGTFPPVPAFVSFTPDSGMSVVGEARDFELTIADGDGFTDIKTVRFVIKQGIGTGTIADAIILEYRSAAPNRIYLYNQATSGWVSAVMGTAAAVENSLCAIDASRTGVTGNGAVLTLNLSITPKAAFIADPISEDKRIWLRVFDLANHRLGDLEIGAWTVTE